MAGPLPEAMRLVEARRFEEAAAALAPLAGPDHDGVIARFRRAEALSRAGRHDDAVEEARRAHADSPGTPATGIWLAQALAESGRFDEAAAVRLPPEHAEFVAPVAAGYVALARLAAADAHADGGDRAAIRDAILDSRHAPIYSLALRLTERSRLASDVRAPDLPSVWYAHECALEMLEDGLTEHPAPPKLIERSGFLGAFLRRTQSSEALRWLRLHAACGDWSELVEAVRAAAPDHPELPPIELEMLLSLGRIDAAEALADRLAKESGKDAAGELCVDRCRIAQLRGRAARPRDLDGFEDATRRLDDALSWLDCCAALMDGDALAARAAADRVSDPSHREYVEAALLRWSAASA